MIHVLPLVRAPGTLNGAHHKSELLAPISQRVLLVGYEDQDNLGLRYLSARLRQAGHQTRFLALAEDTSELVRSAREFAPVVIGFSLIFQFLVPRFAALLAELRRAGVMAHFTMGGHYASFEAERLLDAIPELDSVVRFEGEETLLELVRTVAEEQSLELVDGITFRAGGAVRATRARIGRSDLDELPWPDRDDIPYERRSLPLASILGGRGCPFRCSFCSIVTFYEANGTRGRRRRAPERIVDEMEYLARERGVRILLWQDDDFLAGGAAAVDWAHRIARESIRRGLQRKLRWKISCRSDEVKPGTLAPPVEAGLSHVYLGVEAGDPDNLVDLNKRLSAEAHFAARQTLEQLELSFDFGFMLLEPWSTLDTVQNNLDFLRRFAGDGAASVSFCRTLPYAGTPIERRLREEARLDKQDWRANYRFLDVRLDLFYDWGLASFAHRNHASDGTANLLRVLGFEAALDLPERPRNRALRALVRNLTSLSNGVLLATLESALAHVRTLDPSELVPGSGDPALIELARVHARHDARIREDIALLCRRFPHIVEHISVTE